MKHIRNFLKKTLLANENEENRNAWLEETLRKLPSGLRILDAGAGELKNKPLCRHLIYVAQDVCQYEGAGDGKGLQTGTWDTSQIDLVCDIANVPEPDASFDVILCSEVFEHLTDAVKVLGEFKRLLKPSGTLIITAPFASLVHFAPYHYATGFSKYWYEHHLPKNDFSIIELTANGDWFSYLRQELLRLPSMSRKYGDPLWPTVVLTIALPLLYLRLQRKSKGAEDIACFGWHCIAVKK